MKRGAINVCVFACSICFALPCLSQANPWNGSWKINPATVKYDGPTFTMATDADGYVITRAGKAAPKTICDGNPHKDSTDGAMVTCNKTGSAYVISVMNDGKRTNRITISLSGNTSTRRNQIFLDDGSKSYTVTNEAKRVSAGSGWNGDWKIVSFKESQDKGILGIEVKGDTIAFKETDNDQPVMLKLDGTPVKFMDGTMAVKPNGDHTLKVIYRGKDGQVRRDNTFQLSPDGKTLTETDVTPNPSPSTMSMEFQKM